MTEQSTFTCTSCGSQMIRLDWNTMLDMMVCDNINCGRYHRPGPCIKKAKATLADDLAPLIRKGRLSAKARKEGKIKEELSGYEEEFSPTLEDLRRLRKNLSAKTEEPEVLL